MGEEHTAWLSPTLKAITELSSDSIFLLDRARRITYINRTAEGLRVEDAIGTVIFDLLTKDQATVARAAFDRAEKTGEKTSYEITYPLPDGRLSRWATRIGPQPDGSFVVVSSDVTEHASAQEELNLLFALSRDLLFVTGYDGRFQRVNPAAVDALGYTLSELTACPFLEFVHPEDRQRTQEVFARVVEHGSDVTLFENRYATKDGRYRLLQWTARPDPASRRVIAIARDITDARAMEQQLRQSQKMHAVGQLAGGVAHDFNNLIQSLLGAVDLAKLAGANATILEHLQDIELAAERGSGLVRRLLSFSRQQPISTERFEVIELISGTIQLLRRVLPATIEVRVVQGPGEHPVVADRAQLEQALLNLCLNARDAMPHGGLLTLGIDTLDLREGSLPKFYGVAPGRYVIVTVADEGTGMTPEVRERMFEPFFTTKPMGQGTGLGMSMVYGAATRHGGAVHVDSQPGAGTRVRLLLPIASGEPLAAAASPGAARKPTAGHERILLAEDDAMVRRLCVRVLEGAGYEVLAAANGIEAIEFARQNAELDLALLDVVMPELTGPQAYALIRELHPDMPVMFSSGYAEASNISHAVPEDVPMLSKPLRMTEMLSAVREALDRRAGKLSG